MASRQTINFLKVGIPMISLVGVTFLTLFQASKDRISVSDRKVGGTRITEEEMENQQIDRETLQMKNSYLENMAKTEKGFRTIELLNEEEIPPVNFDYTNKMVARPDYGDGLYNPDAGHGAGRPDADLSSTYQPHDPSEPSSKQFVHS